MSHRVLIVNGADGMDAIYTTGGLQFGLDIRDRTSAGRPFVEPQPVDAHFYECLLAVDPANPHYQSIASLVAIKAREKKMFGHHGEVLHSPTFLALVEEVTANYPVGDLPTGPSAPIEGGHVAEAPPLAAVPVPTEPIHDMKPIMPIPAPATDPAPTTALVVEGTGGATVGGTAEVSVQPAVDQPAAT